MFDVPYIARLLRHCAFYSDIEAYDEIDSTNARLTELCRQGAPQGTVVLAAAQTAGRGRLGRSFYSPPDGGIYMSVLLRPRVPVEETVLVTACAGVCVARAVEETWRLSPQIKWVNDLQLGGKKICGILTQSSLSASGEENGLILGIGLNAASDASGFPPEVRRVATTLREQAGEVRAAPETLIAAILDEVAAFSGGFPENTGRMRREYRARLATLGQTVCLLGDASGTAYRVLDIDERFGLVVENAQGGKKILRSGEVSVRPLPAAAADRDATGSTT